MGTSLLWQRWGIRGLWFISVTSGLARPDDIASGQSSASRPQS